MNEAAQKGNIPWISESNTYCSCRYWFRGGIRLYWFSYVLLHRNAQYQPIFLKEDITPDELSLTESHRNELPELDTIMAHRRLYPRNGFMAHLIGYVGEVTDDMLNQPQFELYNPGDVVGVSGVEKQWDEFADGKERFAPRNCEQPRPGSGPYSDGGQAEPGKQLKLTIDVDLQIAAEEALEGKNGAVVAMDPRTGEILAMVSRPTSDPNHFAVKISKDEWVKLVTDERTIHC